jgi:FlaA1/EpsC-like NDP-sugar epimerase
MALKLLVFSLARLYRVTWCYIGMIDLYNVLKANVVCSMVLAGGLLVTGREEKDLVAVVVLDGLLGLFFIAGTRVLIRLTYHQRSKRGILGPTGATAVRKKAVS